MVSVSVTMYVPASKKIILRLAHWNRTISRRSRKEEGRGDLIEQRLEGGRIIGLPVAHGTLISGARYLTDWVLSILRMGLACRPG
jgi:hypothetical protein